MIVDRIDNWLRGRTEKELARIRWRVQGEAGRLMGEAFARQFLWLRSEPEKEELPRLRMSADGKCPRQRAYQFHRFPEEGKELDPRTLSTFLIGDVVEISMVVLAKLAGVFLHHTIGDMSGQYEIEKEYRGVIRSGHPDGLIAVPGGDFGIVEFKSMAPYTFKRFERGEIDHEYLAQANSYMASTGLEWTCFVAQDKSSGIRKEHLIHIDNEILKRTHTEIDIVIDSSPENLPDRGFEPKKSGDYPWQCSYCPYNQICLVHPGLAVKTKKSGRTVLTKRKQDEADPQAKREDRDEELLDGKAIPETSDSAGDA